MALYNNSGNLSSLRGRQDSGLCGAAGESSGRFCRMAHWVVVPMYWHFRFAGMDCLNHWIPACAGMTRRFDSSPRRNDNKGLKSEIAKGLSGWRQTHSHPCRHSSEGWNPGRRAGRVKEWQVLANGALGCHAYVLAFPLHGNGLSKPLDSSLRLPAAGRPE